MTYIEQIKDEKLREHPKESMKSQIECGGFYHQKAGSIGHGKLCGGQKKMG